MNEANLEVKCMSFYSKYPFNKENRKNKEILYEGKISNLPIEYKDYNFMVDMPNEIKFVIVYKPIKD